MPLALARRRVCVAGPYYIRIASQSKRITPRNARYGIYEAILPYISGTGVLSQTPSMELQSFFLNDDVTTGRRYTAIKTFNYR